MARIGSSPFGHQRVQEPWLWQLRQPEAEVTAAKRPAWPPSRTSLMSVQARFKAAGPR